MSCNCSYRSRPWYASRQVLGILFIFLSATFASPVIADEDLEAGEIRITNPHINLDFRTLGGADQRLEVHGSDLMGDVIDKNSGALQFNHTDISLPGNNSLEVAILRSIKQGQTLETPHQHGFGDWSLKLPIAYSKFSTGNNRKPPVFNQGCMIDSGEMDHAFSVYNSYGISGLVGGYDLTQGLKLDIPGKGTSGRPMGRVNSSGFKFPSDPKGSFVSGGHSTDSSGRCATVVIGPDGTKYKFGRHVVRGAPYHFVGIEHICIHCSISALIKTQIPVGVKYIVFLVTEIEDIHGNWVKYDYTADFMAELTRIHSSDGREILIEYSRPVTNDPLRKNPVNIKDSDITYSSVELRNSRQISRITAAGQQWNYSYAATNNQVVYRALDKVTLPDNRYWRMGDPATRRGIWYMQAVPHEFYKCKPYEFTIEIKHPDGAKGEFRIKETRHIRGVVNNDIYGEDDWLIYMRPMDIPKPTSTGEHCGESTRWENQREHPAHIRPHGWPVYQTMSLVSKKISGASIPSAEWTFDYRNYSGGPLDYNWTKVTDPVGVETTYRYQAIGPEFGLLKEIEFSSPSATQFVRFKYDTLAKFGDGTYYINDFHKCGAGGQAGDAGGICASYDERPMTERTLIRDGVTYTTEYRYRKDSEHRLLDFGSPSKIVKYSTLQKEKRTKEAKYWHNTDANILGRAEKITENGKVTDEYVYNTKGQVIGQKQFGVEAATFDYHADGTLKWYKQWYTPSQARTWQLSDYYRGTARTVKRPDNNYYYKTVDYFGRLLSETNAKGNKTSYQYDEVGRLTRIAPPSGWSPTTITYSNLGAGIIQTATQDSLVATTTYDQMYRPRAVKIDGGETNNIYTRTTYDSLGRKTFESQPSFSATETKGTATKYDGLGRTIEVSETMTPYAKVTTAYLSNNRMQVTDALGHVTITQNSGYGSPTDGEPLVIQNPISRTVFSYNAWGKPTKVTQKNSTSAGTQKSHSQLFYYDARLQLCRVSVPEAGDTIYTYNSAGEMTHASIGQAPGSSCGLPSSNRIAYQYDVMGRNTKIDYPGTATDISRQYDANGNVTHVSNAAAKWEYTYNTLDLLSKETLTVDGQASNFSYNYAPTGEVTRITHPGNIQVAYQLDGFNRPISVGNYITQATYQPNNALDTLTFGNGVTQQFGINQRQLPSSVHIKSAKGTSLRHLELEYDINLNLKSKIDRLQPQYTSHFDYDALNRLTQASGVWGNGAIEYDALGNITQKQMGSHGIDYDYDTKNRLISVSGSEVYLFDYDSRGNVTENAKNGFTYNIANQMTHTDNGIQYFYDGNGKRVKKVKDGKAQYFAYSAKGLLLQKKTDDLTTAYIHINGKVVAKDKR